jgi:hypothetical protein
MGGFQTPYNGIGLLRVSGIGAKNLMRPKSDLPSGHETVR